MALLDQIKEKMQKSARPTRSKLGIKKEDDSYFIGPFAEEDCKYEWVGPYDTKAEATEDMRGMARFIKDCNNEAE